MSGDEELETLRKRRLMELQQKMLQEQQQAEAEQQLEIQKQALMRRILTPEARQRLANLKMVKPQFAAQLELQLIQIAQQGRIELPIDDDRLKEILRRLQSNKKEIRIRRV
ncbi:MAG: DNA-binding protein [Candidatus Bathyarchaeota archaeon]|nr:DNA-binding protein [Candidatus Bathyarchaeota archaeon]